MLLRGNRIGQLKVRSLPGHHPQVISSEINPKFQNMGLGKKMYGEVMRRQANRTLSSDSLISQDANRVWQSMGKSPKYSLTRNPLAKPTNDRGFYVTEPTQAPSQSPILDFIRRLFGHGENPASLPDLGSKAVYTAQQIHKR